MRLIVTVLSVAAIVAFGAFAFWPSGAKTDLVLSFENLPRLANGYHYEGWVMIDGKPWGTGKFNVGENGELVDLDGNAVKDGAYDAGRELSETAMVIITVQPPVDSAAHPEVAEDGHGGDAASHLVGGPVVEGRAALVIDYPAALGTTFGNASGETANDGESLTLTYELPVLPAGWAYEAWRDVDGVSTSLGRFGQAEPAHSDGHDHEAAEGGLLTGELAAGPAGDGGQVVVSLEPAPDDSAERLGFVVLTGEVPAGPGTQAAAPGAFVFPSGVAEIR